MGFSVFAYMSSYPVVHGLNDKVSFLAHLLLTIAQIGTVKHMLSHGESHDL